MKNSHQLFESWPPPKNGFGPFRVVHGWVIFPFFDIHWNPWVSRVVRSFSDPNDCWPPESDGVGKMGAKFPPEVSTSSTLNKLHGWKMFFSISKGRNKGWLRTANFDRQCQKIGFSASSVLLSVIPRDLVVSHWEWVPRFRWWFRVGRCPKKGGDFDEIWTI